MKLPAASVRERLSATVDLDRRAKAIAEARGVRRRDGRNLWRRAREWGRIAGMLDALRELEWIGRQLQALEIPLPTTAELKARNIGMRQYLREEALRLRTLNASGV
jgi:hypothetical protein